MVIGEAIRDKIFSDEHVEGLQQCSDCVRFLNTGPDPSHPSLIVYKHSFLIFIDVLYMETGNKT
jgi:hypothetical protein